MITYGESKYCLAFTCSCFWVLGSRRNHLFSHSTDIISGASGDFCWSLLLYHDEIEFQRYKKFTAMDPGLISGKIV